MKTEELLLAYQWDMKFISIDDMPLSSMLMTIEKKYPDPVRGRWQDALDFLYRLITCGLADITWVGDIERRHDVLLKSLAEYPPLTFDPGFWLLNQVYGTDKCVDLINRHHVDWDSPLISSFRVELESIFDQHNVGMNRSKFIPIAR